MFPAADVVVASAERHGIALIPSLFWYYACVLDLVGEPMDQSGNPQSKVHEWLREYVREGVTRCRNSAAILAWEMGNGFGLQASLSNAASHCPPIQPGGQSQRAR
jgi:hypothetical protein